MTSNRKKRIYDLRVQAEMMLRQAQNAGIAGAYKQAKLHLQEAKRLFENANKLDRIGFGC